MPIVNTQIVETVDITENGQYDVTKYTSANVNVSGGGGSANIEELYVDPSTSEQTIDVTTGVDGYAPIHVYPVTCNIDSNIISENIKSGINILGVTGNYIGDDSGYIIDGEGKFHNILYKDTRVNKPIDFKKIKKLDSYSLFYLYDDFFEFNRFILGKPPRVDLRNLVNIEGKNACKYAFSNNWHYWDNNEHGVGDIKLGKLYNIYGESACEGMFENSVFTSLDLHSLDHINGENACLNMFKNSTYAYIEPEPVESDSSESESESFNDENNENINWEDWEREYRLLENPGIIDFPNLYSISGDYACSSMFEDFSIHNMYNEYHKEISFSKLSNFGGNYIFVNAFSDIYNEITVSFPIVNEIYNSEGIFYGAFKNSYCTPLFPNLTLIYNGDETFRNAFMDIKGISAIEFPKLETIESSRRAFQRAFSNSNSENDSYYWLNTIEFPKLTQLKETAETFSFAFANNENLTTIEFPKLEKIPGYNEFYYAFNNCTNLRDIYFNSLTQISSPAIKSQFNNMLSGCTDVTIHFPTNLNPSKVSDLDTYPNFGGTNTTILYDL